jgi:Domain of unknown function (DUF1917)
MCDDCALPTHPGRRGWLFETVENDYPENTERSGKWCFYISTERIDALWATLRLALAMGKLGNKAKTMPGWYGQKERYVIVIYTYDAADDADVYRIAGELIDLGIDDAFYKTNEQTHQALYNSMMPLKQGGYKPLYRIDQGQIVRVDQGQIPGREKRSLKILRPSVMRHSEWYKDRDPAQWQRVKNVVLARDRFACVYCRFCCKKFMQVNHIDAEDNHEPDNLETVCRACHSVLHMGISSMNDAMSVFECTPEGTNVAAIVCITRSLIAKKTPWPAIERQILERFGLPGGKHYDTLQSVGWANKLLHGIAPSDFRGYLPEGLAVMFHEEGEWNGYPEIIWKWQVIAGSGYRKTE